MAVTSLAPALMLSVVIMNVWTGKEMSVAKISTPQNKKKSLT